MIIAILTLTISLPGCRSKKEKRQRVGGLHERFGRNPAVAVCESGDRNELQSAQWSFVVAAASRREAESICSGIEDKIQRAVDGRLLDVEVEFL